MIISIPDNWDDASGKHTAYLTHRIDRYLSVPPKMWPLSPKTIPFVFSVRTQVISGTYADLVATVPTYEKVIAGLETDHKRQCFVSDLQKLFNYSAFSKKSSSGWNAYSLCETARYKTCPYCNQSYAFTIVAEEGSFRPTLDHFLFKEHYPYLALSLNNLVPSCYHCNSNLKGAKDFRLDEHLHPFVDAENIVFSINHGCNDIVELVSNFGAVKDTLQVTARVKNSCVKSANSLNTFLIAQRYAKVSEEAASFIDRKLGINELFETFKDLGLPFDEQRVLGFDKGNYRNLIMGKMYADLYDEFSR